MPANADDIFREYYEPVRGQEIFLAQETGAHIKGFISVAEWQAHQLAEARRPINRLRRVKRRIQGRIVRAVNNRWGSGWE